MPHLHPKTFRRVMILVGGAALLVALAVGVYALRQWQIERDLAVARAEGLAASERGDYLAALDHLKRYVQRHKDDPAALYAYGVARSRVEEPNNLKHFEEPILVMRTVLKLDPDHDGARHALLELYTRTNRNTEAKQLAGELLAQDANDAEALRALGIAHERLGEYEQAASAYERLNEARPTDLSGHFATFRVYERLKKPGAEVLARAEAMAQRHPDDPRFLIVLAIAHDAAGDTPRALELLKQAAATEQPPDAEFVRTLAGILERNRMFDESQALLERSAARTSDPAVQRVLVQRLWQEGRHAEVARRLAPLDANDPKADAHLLALRALSLHELGRTTEARAAAEALSARRGEPAALAWGATLNARFADPALEPKAAIQAYEKALVRDPNNAVARFALGRAYEQLGETELAINAWARAAELAASWSRPQQLIARALATTGRTKEALARAQIALSAAPPQRKLDAEVTLALVQFLHLRQSPEAGDAVNLLKRVASIQRRRPHEPETLPIYVALLAKGGRRQEAVAVIQSVLEHPTGTTSAATQPTPSHATTTPASPPTTTQPSEPLDQGVLLQLVAVSRAERLGMEQALMERIEQVHAGRLTPALALARAALLASHGRPMDGLVLLESAAREAIGEVTASSAADASDPTGGGDGAAGDGPSEATELSAATRNDGVTPAAQSAQAQVGDARAVEWRLALAEYREYIDDPGAALDWVALGNAHPTNLQVQTAILKDADSVRHDRGFVDLTIKRVKALTGDEGTLWQIERARWLLGSDDQKELSDAANTLRTIVTANRTLIEPRLLRAAALEKLDNVEAAIHELQAAMQLDPDNAQVALELARMLQAQARFDDARAHLDRLALDAGDLPPEAVRRVAELLADQGEVDRGIGLLEAMYLADLGSAPGGAGAGAGGATRPASTNPATAPTTAGAARPAPAVATGDAGQVHVESAERVDTAGRLLLAQLYRRRGRLADAQAVYDRMLAQPVPEPRAIHAAADFYASRGNFTLAQATLARLEQAQLRPGVRELILADFNEKHGNRQADAALRHLVDATRRAPDDPQTWRALAAYLLRTGRAGDAVAAVERGLQALPDDNRLRVLRLQVKAIARALAAGPGPADATSDPALASLIDALSREPGHAQTVAVLQLLHDSRAGILTPDQLTARLRQLAGRYPRDKGIRAELVRRYLAEGDAEQAVAAARESMKLLPQDADVARLAVEVMRRTQRWPAMEDAARAWRQRTLERPVEADMAIAEALLAQGDAAGAVEQLAAHVEQLESKPEQNTPLLLAYARALAVAGRADEARALLEPVLPQSHEARRAWLEVAAQHVDDAGRAVEWVRHASTVANVEKPEASQDDRTAVAAAWHAVGMRFGQPDAFAAARAAIAPIADRTDPPPPADALFLLGSIEEGAGQVDAAEAAYRRAVQLAPGHAAALNNLAYLLLTRRPDDAAALNEARTLAERATALAQSEPNFRDTLARVYLRLGRAADALAEFQRALETEPAHLEALVGQATALVALDRREEAGEVIRRIDELLAAPSSASAARPALSESLRRELDDARRALATAAAE